MHSAGTLLFTREGLSVRASHYTIMNYPRNSELHAWWVDHPHSTISCKVFRFKTSQRRFPLPRAQRSWISQQVYCISSCWPGQVWIPLFCSINLDNKLGMDTVWHKSVNQTKKQALFVCKHTTFCKPKSFSRKRDYKLIIKSTLDVR